MEGNRKDIVNLPLALSVGNISEAGICLERESALSLLLSILPDMASEIVTELLNTSRKNYATLLEKHKTESRFVFGSDENQMMCADCIGFWNNYDQSALKIGCYHCGASNVGNKTRWMHCPV